MWDHRRFHFFDRLRIWCTPKPEEDLVEPNADCNISALSDSFWQEVQAHPLPVDNRVIRELTNIPGCLDLYMWLCWRCFQAKRKEVIPLFGSSGLASQLGVVDYSRDRNFRKRLREWLKLVLLYWPQCPARLTDDGRGLTVGPSCAIASAGVHEPAGRACKA